MRMIIDKAGTVWTSTPADDFLFSFMLGYECQGHGPVRVRGFVPFVKYLRLTYGWDLEQAVGVARAWEAQRKLELACKEDARATLDLMLQKHLEQAEKIGA